VSQVTDMSSLFSYTNFNDRIDRWEVGNVAWMINMFYYVTAFNRPLDTWDVSRVTTMNGMLYGASSFNQPLSTWNVGRVTNMFHMFFCVVVVQSAVVLVGRQSSHDTDGYV
jgi:surface protein